MNQKEITALRREIGNGVLKAQEMFKNEPTQEVIVQILAGLLSLAANVAYDNAKISLSQYRFVFEESVKERWRL